MVTVRQRPNHLTDKGLTLSKTQQQRLEGGSARTEFRSHSVWSTQELVRNAESQPLSPKQNKLFNKVPSDLKAH